MLSLLCLLAAVFALRQAVRHRGATGAKRLLLWASPVLLFAAAIALGPRGHLLTKTLGRLVMPMGLIWLITLGAATAAAWRERPQLASGLAALWMLVTVSGSGPLAAWLGAEVEGSHAWARPLDAGPFDAVIVLGGGTTETPRGEAQLGMSGDRVMLGARLYRRGRTPLLVASGSPIEGMSTHDSGRAAQLLWTELGVPPEDIVLVEGAQTTSEEARLHAREARERGWARVGLVSSARHLPRALARFEEAGLRPTALPADVHSRPVVWRGLYDLVPNAGDAHELHGILWELAGRAAGR